MLLYTEAAPWWSVECLRRHLRGTCIKSLIAIAIAIQPRTRISSCTSLCCLASDPSSGPTSIALQLLDCCEHFSRTRPPSAAKLALRFADPHRSGRPTTPHSPYFFYSKCASPCLDRLADSASLRGKAAQQWVSTMPWCKYVKEYANTADCAADISNTPFHQPLS